MRCTVVSIIALPILLGSAQAQEASRDPAGWQEDLQVLARELPSRHPNAFANITSAQWDSAVGALDARLPSLSWNQWTAELQRLVALLGDAHSAVNPAFDAALAARYYPLDLYLFNDGLFVRGAAPEYASLVGARVVGVGRVSVDSAMTVVGSTISHENEWWVKAWAPFRMMIPEVLDGLGLVDDMERLPLVVEIDGATDTVTVQPAGPLHTGGHNPMAPIDKTGWTDMRQSADPPMWQRNPDRLLWFEYMPESGTLYVGYRAVMSPPHGPSNRTFWNEVFAEVDRREVSRLVIDIRENGGGNGFLNKHVIQQILARPQLDRPESLYTIIGRRTFSAAQQLTNQLDWWTQTTFVGEPTGQKTSQYGDHEPLVLRRSGITVNISSVFHQAPNVFDRRSFIAPDVYTPLTSADYRDGVDPAMRAILEPKSSGSVVATIQEAIEAGDVERAERLLEAAKNDVVNRFQSFEAELNSLGYQMLNGDDREKAIAVFELNTRAYAHSANTFDSLGEALAILGRREDAIAAYRSALEIDPDYAPALEGLRRLGAGR